MFTLKSSDTFLNKAFFTRWNFHEHLIKIEHWALELTVQLFSYPCKLNSSLAWTERFSWNSTVWRWPLGAIVLKMEWDNEPLPVPVCVIVIYGKVAKSTVSIHSHFYFLGSYLIVFNLLLFIVTLWLLPKRVRGTYEQHLWKMPLRMCVQRELDVANKTEKRYKKYQKFKTKV